MQCAAPSSDEIPTCIAWQSLESCHAAHAIHPFLQAQLPARGPHSSLPGTPNTALVLTKPAPAKGLGQTPGPFSISGRLGQEEGAVRGELLSP